MSDELIQALRAYKQVDADGVMVVVSREACEKAADALEKSRSERATLHGIAYAKYREWQDGMNTADDFVRWAQSRALNALGDWPEKPPHDVKCECSEVGPDYCPRHTP